MFGPSYFGPTYFGTTYFASGSQVAAVVGFRSLFGFWTGGGGAPPGPEDVIEAIIEKWQATPALTAISARLWFDDRPAPVTYPYATLTQMGSRSFFNTGTGYWEAKLFQFDIHDTDQDRLADEFGPAVEENFDFCHLTFRNGYLMNFKRRSDRFNKLARIGVGSPFVWCRSYTYEVTVGRTLA